MNYVLLNFETVLAVTYSFFLQETSTLPNGLPTSNTEVEIGIVTPGKKSIISNDAIIDMHLHNENDRI